jgi:hypothetical protein
MMASRLGSIDLLFAGIAIVATLAAGCGRGPKVPTASVSGTVTINGRGVANVQVTFDPVEKIRPAYGITDATGRYTAQFLNTQSGVPLGDCVVRITYNPGGSPNNVLPESYSTHAEENPELRLTVPAAGLEFNYDIKTDKPLPSVPGDAIR